MLDPNDKNTRIAIVFEQLTDDGAGNGAIAVRAEYNGRRITEKLLEGEEATIMEHLAVWTMDAVTEKMRQMAATRPEDYTAYPQKDELN